VLGKKINLFPLARNQTQSLFRSVHSLVTNQTELTRISDYTTGWTVRCSNPGAAKRFYSIAKRPDRLCVSRSLLFNVYWGYFVGVMRAGREGNRSPSYTGSMSVLNLHDFIVWTGRTLPLLYIYIYISNNLYQGC
jgi:hypothetical protein